jgi:hypothetical protein
VHLRFNINLEKPIQQIGDFAWVLRQQMQCDWDNTSAEKRCSTIFMQTTHLHAIEDRFRDMNKMDDPDIF